MAFNLGNFAVKEVIYGVAEKMDHSALLYTLDQLSSAEISVEADSTDITDKNGSIIRTIYNSKTATVSATSALVSPAILNAASGSDAELGDAIVMPKIAVVAAGGTLDVSDAEDATTALVMGIFPNGANGKALTYDATGSAGGATFTVDEGIMTLPTELTGGAPQYIVKYERKATGLKLVNKADEFPETIALTFYAAVMDPCQDGYRAAYIVVPSFTPDPSVTISLSSDSQEMDYSGNINVSYCDACAGKVLYYIFFPDEQVVTTVECAE